MEDARRQEGGSLLFFASSAGRPVDVRALFFLPVEFGRKADRAEGHIERPRCQEEEELG